MRNAYCFLPVNDSHHPCLVENMASLQIVVGLVQAMQNAPNTSWTLVRVVVNPHGHIQTRYSLIARDITSLHLGSLRRTIDASTNTNAVCAVSEA